MRKRFSIDGGDSITIGHNCEIGLDVSGAMDIRNLHLYNLNRRDFYAIRRMIENLRGKSFHKSKSKAVLTLRAPKEIG